MDGSILERVPVDFLRQYGEGDRFIGIKVPVTRNLVKSYLGIATLADCDALLNSEWAHLTFVNAIISCLAPCFSG